MAQPTNRRLVTEASLETRLTVMDYDSGTRNITSLIPEIASGKLLLTRIAKSGTLEFDEVKFTGVSGSFWGLSYSLPTGFRPPSGRYQWDDLMTSSPVSGTPRRVRLDWTGRIIIYGLADADTITGRIPYIIRESPASTPPGDAT